MNRNRCIALILSLCLAVGILSPAIASPYDIYIQPFQVITTQKASVRSEEGGNDWYLIFYEGGLAYVSTTAAEPRQESSNSVPAYSASILLLTNQLAYVRSGPASTTRQIAKVSKGTYFWAYKQVPSDEGGNPWYMIDYYGQIAYISSTTVNVQ